MQSFPTPADCRFCLSNHLLKGDALTQSEGAYAIDAMFGEHHYLILPKQHIESPLDLPDTWWHDVKVLLAAVGLPSESYNLSFNIGGDAGQTQKHLHLWVVPRPAGHPAAGKGLARLVAEAGER